MMATSKTKHPGMWIGIMVVCWAGGVALDGFIFQGHSGGRLCYVLLWGVMLELIPERRNGYWLIPALLGTIPLAYWLDRACVVAIHDRNLAVFFLGRGTGYEGFISTYLHGIVLAFVVSVVWFVSPRRKPSPRFYQCTKCGYDLHGSLHSPNCPECGRVLVIGTDIPDHKQQARALEALQTDLPTASPVETSKPIEEPGNKAE